MSGWLAAFCVFGAGVIRGMTGFGFAAIAVVGLGMLWPLPGVVPVVLCLEVAACAVLVPPAWREAAWPLLRRLLLAAVVGIPLGILVLTHFDGYWLGLAVYLLIGVLAVFGLLGIKLSPAGSTWTPWLVGASSGALIAAFSIGGPLVAAWLGHCGLHAARLRATLIVFFCAVDCAALAALFVAGAVPAHTFANVLILLAPTFAGLGCGMWLLKHVPPKAAVQLTQWLLLGLALAGLAGGWRS